MSVSTEQSDQQLIYFQEMYNKIEEKKKREKKKKANFFPRSQGWFQCKKESTTLPVNSSHKMWNGYPCFQLNNYTPIRIVKVLKNQFYPEAFLLLFYRRNVQVSSFVFYSLWLLMKIPYFVFKNGSTNLKDSHSHMEGKEKQNKQKRMNN